MASKQFLVIGVGRFGSAVATTLFDRGHEVVAIDMDEGRIDRIMDRVTHAVIGDATDQSTLDELGVSNFDAVVVAIGTDFEANILATLAAKAAGAAHVLSKAVSEPGARVLSQIGADVVVRPEHDMGLRVARQLTTPDLVDAFQLGEDHAVVEMEAGEKLTGSLRDLRLPNRFGVSVIAVQRAGELKITPTAEFEIVRGDIVVLIGSRTAMDEFQDHLG